MQCASVLLILFPVLGPIHLCFHPHPVTPFLTLISPSTPALLRAALICSGVCSCADLASAIPLGLLSCHNILLLHFCDSLGWHSRHYNGTAPDKDCAMNHVNQAASHISRNTANPSCRPHADEDSMNESHPSRRAEGQQGRGQGNLLGGHSQLCCYEGKGSYFRCGQRRTGAKPRLSHTTS